MPSDFLVQQMAWREALDDAHGDAALAALEHEVRSAESEQLAQLAHWLDRDANAARAAERVRALMFIQRFRSDLAERLDSLQH
jgi:molecular chaperone HscB